MPLQSCASVALARPPCSLGHQARGRQLRRQHHGCSRTSEPPSLDAEQRRPVHLSEEVQVTAGQNHAGNHRIQPPGHRIRPPSYQIETSPSSTVPHHPNGCTPVSAAPWSDPRESESRSGRTRSAHGCAAPPCAILAMPSRSRLLSANPAWSTRDHLARASPQPS